MYQNKCLEILGKALVVVKKICNAHVPATNILFNFITLLFIISNL